MALDAATCAALLPKRPRDGHKGSFGTLLCVCGSLDYAGAALLCGLGAARAGAGLVVLAVPAALQPVIAGRVPELVTVALPEQPAGRGADSVEAEALVQAKAPDALAIGCGMAENEGNRELVLRLLAAAGPAAVLDGGALNLLARSGRWWAANRRDCVLTPHPGEYARIMGTPAGATDDAREASAKAAAERFGQVVVLKGARTVIASPDGQVATSPFANAALATAGSGDVLAGTIGALMAQRLTPFDAARVGVWLHGRAGERVSERLGDSGLIASDLPYEIAVARHELAATRA
ncbi:MAG: ADP-dependent NAD(P)H-hydrate dehydratase / NAD(P)H-hydrate epimerase [Chloroflexota bacterium]|nr:ADP-dependent NAD(P)H-hydrate dehydratase / NAD(P)H-hydrate epimerase [Chloroflexota bacterium]